MTLRQAQASAVSSAERVMVSPEELQIERLRRELKIPTKQWRPSKPGRESG